MIGNEEKNCINFWLSSFQLQAMLVMHACTRLHFGSYHSIKISMYLFLLGFFHSSAAQSWDNISWNGMRSGIWYTANNKTIMDNSGSNTRNFLFSTRKLCYRPLYTWSSTCTRILTLFETTKIWSITLQIPKKHKYTIEIDNFCYYFFFLLAAALFRNHTARKSHINTKTTHFDKRLKKKKSTRAHIGNSIG